MTTYMNMTIEDARVARRLRGTVKSSRNLFRVLRLTSFSASSNTWISDTITSNERQP